jgi:hypothetical protein
MWDHGFSLSLQAVRHQLAAMPCGSYLIRLIHHLTRRPFPGERLWTGDRLLAEPTLRFLRARNREGFDIYFRPYEVNENAGYILVDLDDSPPMVLAAMRANGHEPCTVIETSPGHLQVWIRVSEKPLAPAVATQIARHLARLYQGDRASADWRHVGRLAGFTNQKPRRRLPSGWPPWVKLRYAEVVLASEGRCLVEAASQPVRQATTVGRTVVSSDACRSSIAIPLPESAGLQALASAESIALYQTWLNRFQIPQRFPRPDWSIADLWIAKALLLRGVPAERVKSILRLASPQFPRSHADPEDYLRRTLERAVQDIACSAASPFPARQTTSTGF